MQPKKTVDLAAYAAGIELLSALPDTPDRWHRSGPGTRRHVPLGAFAGLRRRVESCIGCGEAAAVRLLLSATAFEHGQDRLAVIAAPGCPSEFSSVYPFNPYQVSWSNALWQNAAAEAIGVRLKWDQEGHSGRKLWVIGGYTTMFESGLQSLSRLLTSGLDLKVFVARYGGVLEHRRPDAHRHPGHRSRLGAGRRPQITGWNAARNSARSR